MTKIYRAQPFRASDYVIYNDSEGCTSKKEIALLEKVLSQDTLPILYSFRRCPYAIRARLALAFAEIEVNIIEVSLKNKPQRLLDISPKASVPVLHLHSGSVIDESRDIMHWAFAQPNSHCIEGVINCTETAESKKLIDQNDNEFKYWLNRYKYNDRYCEYSLDYARQQVLFILQALDCRLQDQPFLFADNFSNNNATLPSFADIAIFPFIRQCAAVDVQWFDNLPLNALQTWLTYWLEQPLFTQVMKKKD